MSVLASNETPGRYDHFQAELEGTLTSDGVSRLFVRVAAQADKDNLSDMDSEDYTIPWNLLIEIIELSTMPVRLMPQ